jgi:hypothetical protein
MEATRTSETSVDIDLRTRQYIPEDFELHTRRCENLKSHIIRLNVMQSQILPYMEAITTQPHHKYYPIRHKSLKSKLSPTNQPAYQHLLVMYYIVIARIALVFWYMYTKPAPVGTYLRSSGLPRCSMPTFYCYSVAIYCSTACLRNSYHHKQPL